MRSRVEVRAKEVARNLGRFRNGVQAEGIEALRERVAVLEDEVQECRQRNLRLAELTDQLPLDLRPPPSVAAYDSLLTGTRDA